MSSLSERVEQSLDELDGLVREILEAARHSELEVLDEQIRELKQAIRNLERKGKPVRESWLRELDELEQERTELTAEINAPEGPASAARRLRDGLEELVRKLPQFESFDSEMGVVITPPDDSPVYRQGLPPAGSSPVSVRIGGDEESLRVWSEVPVKTANWMLENGHPLPDDGIVHKSHVMIADDPSRFFGTPRRLADGRYINVNYSAGDCVLRSRQLLARAGLGPETLEVAWREPRGGEPKLRIRE